MLTYDEEPIGTPKAGNNRNHRLLGTEAAIIDGVGGPTAADILCSLDWLSRVRTKSSRSLASAKALRWRRWHLIFAFLENRYGNESAD